jgi:hypothetical protein
VLKSGSFIVELMTFGHGYKATYDYVELFVEQREGHWRLTLRDRRHGEDLVHEDEFSSATEAQDAGLALAQHHINIEHNDTLLLRSILSWQEY